MRFSLPVVAVVSALAFASSARATPAATSHFSYKGQSADAFFSSTSGCVETYAYVAAADGKVKYDGTHQVDSGITAAVGQYDICAGVEIANAYGSAALTPDQFVIDKQLGSASLNATVTLDDYDSGASFPVDVALTWSGRGGIIRDKEHSHVSTPGFKLNATFDGSYRDAAASGTISDGLTNFAPEPAIVGSMRSVKSAEVDISQ